MNFEDVILRAALTSPEQCQQLVARFNGDAPFYEPGNERVWQAVREVFSRGEDVTEFAVCRQLKEKLGASPLALRLSMMADKTVLAHELSEAIEQVWGAHVARRSQQAMEEAQADVAKAPHLHRKILLNLAGTLNHLAGEPEGTSRAAELLDSRRFNPDARYSDPESVYELNRVTICTPGNLTCITAQAKTGKTALLSAMMASTFALDGADTLTLTSRNPAGHALLHFDSEQSIEDHWRVIDRTRRRAGVERLPAWLLSWCLTGVPMLELRAAVREAARMAAREFGGIHSIFIDGHADLVNDVNDPAEANAYVASMHAMAIHYACPIIGVIHFNPGGDKVRGHLGSQLERKSETNLTLEKDGDVTLVWSVKQRRGSIPREFGPRFRWSDDAGMHVTASVDDDPKLRAKLDTWRIEVADVFNGRPAMRYSELVSNLKTTRKMADRTAERRVADWRRYRLVESSAAGLFTQRTCA